MYDYAMVMNGVLRKFVGELYDYVVVGSRYAKAFGAWSFELRMKVYYYSSKRHRHMILPSASVWHGTNSTFKIA